MFIMICTEVKYSKIPVSTCGTVPETGYAFAGPSSELTILVYRVSVPFIHVIGEKYQKVSKVRALGTRMARIDTETYGPFLESPKNVLHPESHSKISNFMITEMFYLDIFNMKRGFLHTRSFRRIP